jgi:hypothetical protein
MQPGHRVLALGWALVTAGVARGASQAPRQRPPLNPTLSHPQAGLSRRPREVEGRYEYFDPASGIVWAIVLNPEGTAEILVNGHSALTTTGELQTFRYRVTGKSLYMWDSGSHREELYGSFVDSTLTTIAGWRFRKHS